MRKPNGYGCIKRLSGNRRRPFVFVISENGKQRPVEYFTNQIDAEIFQADYNKTHNHHSLPGHQITLEELYHRWLPAHTQILRHQNQHCAAMKIHLSISHPCAMNRLPV